MTSFGIRRYAARFASTPDDLVATQKLRARAFLGQQAGIDRDRFDEICSHVLVEETVSGRLVCCFRILPLRGGSEIGRSYSSQFYELSALEKYEKKMVEMGRFCIESDLKDPDILRVAWAAMTRYVDDEDIGMLFGCSSFKGIQVETYLDSFAMLGERHLAPSRWWPRVKSPSIFRFSQILRRRQTDVRLALQRMPPLLRSYLMMGGWVSDHAVIDTEMNTLHVFTGVEITAIPDARKRLLRAIAG